VAYSEASGDGAQLAVGGPIGYFYGQDRMQNSFGFFQPRTPPFPARGEEFAEKLFRIRS
jgi:hypothetical protein